MPEIYADFIFSLSRIAAMFIACAVLSPVSFYVSMMAAYGASGGLLSSGNKRPSRFIFAASFIIAGAFPFVSFPAAAYYLWADFKTVVPFTIPALNFAALFALTPVFFVLGWRKKERIKEYRRTWHPQNGRRIKHYPGGELYEVSNWKNGKMHGEYITYYESGKPRRQGFYENGHPVGIVIEYDYGGNVEKTAFHNADGKPVWHNRYYDGILMQEDFNEDRRRTHRSYYGNGNLSSESITDFEIDSNGRLHTIKTTARYYHHETGDLIKEDVQDFDRNK